MEIKSTPTSLGNKLYGVYILMSLMLIYGANCNIVQNGPKIKRSGSKYYENNANYKNVDSGIDSREYDSLSYLSEENNNQNYNSLPTSEEDSYIRAAHFTQLENYSDYEDDVSDFNKDYNGVDTQDYSHHFNDGSGEKDDYSSHGDLTIHDVNIEHRIPVPHFEHFTYPIHKPLKINIPKPVLIGIPKPYPVKIPVNKPVAVPVETEITIPVEKVVPYPVVKHIPYPVERKVPVKVEKAVTVHVPKPYPIKIPVYKTIHHKGR